MTNYLAEELRQILIHVHDNDELPATATKFVRERLLRLIEHVEKLGADVVETTTTTETRELDLVVSGLEPEQEIRARGLERAIDLYAPAIVELADVWKLADQCAAYIRDGIRP